MFRQLNKRQLLFHVEFFLATPVREAVKRGTWKMFAK
jgi:hypothetical protein